MNSSKTPKGKEEKKNRNNKRPIVKHETPISVMKDTINPNGCQYSGSHIFSCGQTVPIYEVSNVHALNQLIGYAKFINQSYGDVYYRGECKLHDTLLPGLLRGRTSTSCSARLNKKIKEIINDDYLKKQLKLDSEDEASSSLIVEGLLQHYGIKTRFLDVVDNHWVALWMGLFRNTTIKQMVTYNHYAEREIPLVDFANGKKVSDEEMYQYILLLAIPGKSKRSNNGIYTSNDFYEIDLRQALPSTFLRPHAQHGWVIRKRSHTAARPADYDMATSVVGIIKIRIDRAKQWIGSGELLSQDNLFPPPAYDNGYDILLQRSDLFEGEFSITKYV